MNVCEMHYFIGLRTIDNWIVFIFSRYGYCPK
jgi:hypothetical protein